ncbi:phophatidylserine decarboxylase associated domain-containing protein [Lacinutrix neustonica]|uniref:Phophatidylserine decarboxylase associated domain-containing protein n=1 Tax=Lacinutrix neustonica TaxID=2980107 RepID=A0A9E8MY71_9FLAO|nr:phophatidylserine decarboxylase associated domain-containing protein [Lacinutrix neustonica]WAC02444.1 phophatidylserine decarboxylase associated domain-containing protein [Lacinutrix neustonica]
MKMTESKPIETLNPVKDAKIQYKQRFGVIAGYLPKDIQHIGKWLSTTAEAAQKEKKKQGAEYTMAYSILQMKAMLIKNRSLEIQVAAMIHEALAIHKAYEPHVQYTIASLDDLFVAMNYIIQRAPEFEPKVSHTAFPMSRPVCLYDGDIIRLVSI